MNRKIKALCLALVAALALTAVVASSASAQFTSTSNHTVLSGSQAAGKNHVFTAGTGIGAINCKKATFSGTANNVSETTQVITPAYAECKDSLGRTVHVNVGSAKYEFTSGAGKSFVHIIGGSISLTVTGSPHCTITITTQTEKNNVAYAQSGNNLEVTTTTNNVHSHVAGGFFACGTAATTSATGTYTGTTIMEGNAGAAKISIH